jgi:cytochrome P450
MAIIAKGNNSIRVIFQFTVEPEYQPHQREDLYPQPKRFKRDRFLERQFSPYEYLPFGSGQRRCIGMAFAQFEMKVVLAEVLSRFELALVDNRSQL